MDANARDELALKAADDIIWRLFTVPNDREGQRKAAVQVEVRRVIDEVLGRTNDEAARLPPRI